jgi:hypothetical protein
MTTTIQGSKTIYAGKFLQCLLITAVITMMALTGGCTPAGSGHDISDIKITDFSMLEVPGKEASAVLVVSIYDVPIEKFALVRIFAAGTESLIKPSYEEYFKKDGIYCGRFSFDRFKGFEQMLYESLASEQRTISMLLYDQMSNCFWFEPGGEEILIYNDGRSMPRSLDLSEGRLGFMLAMSTDTQPLPLLLAAPVFQKRFTIPEIYLRRSDLPYDTGRTVIESLSVSAMIKGGDFLLFCPDAMPLDEMTFSKHAFRAEDETKFRIYSIFCKGLTERS